MRTQHRLFALILSFVALSASAFDRQFPADAKRGAASFHAYPKIFIDGTAYRPAPGLRIWNTLNMIQFQTALKSENVIVNYTIDPYRLVDKIWILTPTEAAKSLQMMGRQGVTTNITVTTPKTTTIITTGTTGTTAVQTRTDK